MSTLSSLYARLNECEAKLVELNAIQEKIAAAMEAYSAVAPEFSNLLSYSQNFVNNDILSIYDSLSGLGGNRIEQIAGDVLTLNSSDQYYSKISQLQADVEKTYSQLTQKESEVKVEIMSLKSTITSLRQQIREEEARIAEEAARAAQQAKNANNKPDNSDKPPQERNNITNYQANKYFG